MAFPRGVIAVVKYIKNAGELVALLIFYFTLLRAPFITPVLDVSYEVIPLLPPVGIEVLTRTSSSAAPPQSISVPSPATLAAISKLTASKDLVVVELKNNSSSSINELDLRLRGVTAVADAALSSDSSRVLEHKNDLVKYTLDETESVLSFTALSGIPPKSLTHIIIWCNLEELNPEPLIRVTSTAASTRVDSIARTSLIGQFIGDNFISLTTLAGCYFLLLALWRSRKPRTTSA